MCCKGVIFFFSWKTAERLFLDAMEKIKAIGNEVNANLLNCVNDEHLENMTMSLWGLCNIFFLFLFFFKIKVTVDKWEPLLNNLGHVCRKLK